MSLNREQEIALKKLQTWIDSKDYTPRGLIGRAGTGKTFLLNHLELPFNTVGVAPTLQAVGVLSNSLNCECVSFDSLTFSTKTYDKDKVIFKSDTKKWYRAKRYSLIIVDEASMLSEENVALLHKIYSKSKILFVGDIGQLPSIDDENYSVFKGLTCYMLTKNERSGDDNPLLSIANKNYLNESISIDKKNNLSNGKGYVYVKVKDIPELFINREIDTICVATNRMRENINNEIHNLLFPGTTYGVGEVLISNENIDYQGGKGTTKYRITNSELVRVITSTQISKLINVLGLSIDVLYDDIETNKGNIHVLNFQYINTYNKFLNDIRNNCMKDKAHWNIYHEYKEYFHNVSYSYAITIHKAQGSGFDNIGVYYNDISNFFNKKIVVNLFYTALTRARKICYIITD